MPSHSQQTLIDLLSDLHETLQRRFVTCSRSDADRRSLLLGLELLWKIEEQVVMPALQDAKPSAAAEVAIGTREIDVMRDLSQRIERSSGAARGVVLAALEGIVRLHCARSETLLAHAGSNAVDWRALRKDVLDLLGRWRTEIHADGEIEDEERDPVGLPPR